MRQIKFKMYCGSVMYSHDDCLINDFDPRTTTAIDGEKCHWLEFTGLKDKNKKEIYFNHICKLTVELYHDEGYMNHWYIGIVSFMPSLGYYLAVKKGFDIDNDEPLISFPKIKHIAQYRTELLGNYFENKNLLES